MTHIRVEPASQASPAIAGNILTVDMPDTDSVVASPETAPDASADFDALVAQHVEQYRPPVGALVHPETVTVVDPYATVDEAVSAQVDHHDAWTGLFLAMTLTVFVVGCGAGAFMESLVTIWASMGVTIAAAASLPIWWDARAMAAWVANRPNMLSVPADVGAAYTAYTSAPAALRKTGANETVIASVEAHSSYADGLLAEAHRLHDIDASATPEGLAVRDALVDLAAQAQTLTTLAQRHRAMVDAATLTTPMLLAHRPDRSVFRQAAETMTEETVFVRGILDASIPDRLPSNLT